LSIQHTQKILHYSIWSIQVYSYVIWIDQCPCLLDVLDEQSIIDDILIFFKNEEKNDEHLHLVLQKLRENQLYAKLNKCEFWLKEVSFPGHIISEGGISVDPSKVKGILSWNTPQNVSDIMSFLGMVGYYRRFIEGFSMISKPMTELLEKSKTFEWAPRREASFQELKKRLTTAPALTMPDMDNHSPSTVMHLVKV
jgi:hypothetical protein